MRKTRTCITTVLALIVVASAAVVGAPPASATAYPWTCYPYPWAAGSWCLNGNAPPPGTRYHLNIEIQAVHEYGAAQRRYCVRAVTEAGTQKGQVQPLCGPIDIGYNACLLSTLPASRSQGMFLSGASLKLNLISLSPSSSPCG
jgi:hypothetical protein